MKQKEFAIIGLGRFGFNLAKDLVELGNEVLVLDVSDERVQEAAPIVSHAVQGDAMDEDVLKDLGLSNFETVIVAIGQDIEASIMVTMTLKEMGVKQVVVKALNDRHGKVLKKVGADKVIYPEKDMAHRLARHLVAHNFLDYLELSSEYGLIEMHPPKFMIGKTLGEVNLRKNKGVSVIAIKKSDRIITVPRAEALVEEGDIIVVIGAYKELERLQEE